MEPATARIATTDSTTAPRKLAAPMMRDDSNLDDLPHPSTPSGSAPMLFHQQLADNRAFQAFESFDIIRDSFGTLPQLPSPVTTIASISNAPPSKKRSAPSSTDAHTYRNDCDWVFAQGASPYIKRPMNSFMLWSKSERKRLAQENPEKDNSEVSTMLGHKWKEMSAQDKQPFVVQATKLKEHHRRTFPAYRY